MPIKKNSVLVLGAGASASYGLPLGNDLVRLILEDIDAGGDRRAHAAKWTKIPYGTLTEIATKLSLSKTDSIDDWLLKHNRFLEAGKVLICHAINSCEDSSHFGYNANPALKDKWMHWLWNRMKDGLTRVEQLREQNDIAFVTFNYDRMPEHFLFEAAANSFDCSEEEAAKAIRQFEFVHIHGQSGFLEWDKPNATDVSNPYKAKSGTEGAWELAVRCAKSIRIASEQNPSQTIIRARELLALSRQTFLLGMGYHASNLKKLAFGGDARCDIRGTFLGAPRSKDAIVDSSRNGLGRPIILEEMDCSKILNTFFID